MKNFPEDKEIIAQILQGGHQAERSFQILVEKYGRSIYSQIYTLLRNEAQSKDVLQNVLVKIWTNLDGFREDSGLYTWIYRITRNESLNHLKKEKLRSSVSLEGPILNIIPGHPSLDQITEEEISDLLSQAIDLLPEKQALVFQLKYFEDLKYSEISARVGTSEGALKASYHHAVQKIEEFLKSKLNH
jgi:RNA polymerase sigma-70 factor (ECF subfamily)